MYCYYQIFCLPSIPQTVSAFPRPYLPVQSLLFDFSLLKTIYACQVFFKTISAFSIPYLPVKSFKSTLSLFQTISALSKLYLPVKFFRQSFRPFQNHIFLFIFFRRFQPYLSVLFNPYRPFSPFMSIWPVKCFQTISAL